MLHEDRPWTPNFKVLAGLALTSLGVFLALGLAAGERASDALVLGIRVYAMASDVAVRWVTHHLDQVVMTVGSTWALMATLGIWILWRVSRPAAKVRDPGEVSHGS